MKKYLLLATIILQTTFLFGQNTTYTWGPWVQNPCFKGLQSRSKVRDYNSSAKQYTWDIEIKNNYSSKISFNFDIQNSSIDGRTSINPGGVDKGWTLNPSNTNLYVEFSKVCFDPNDHCSINSNGTQNKGYKCFAECDNGVPNVPKLCGNINSSNQTNNSNQQNDLSEYNRSKADLERQMQEKNAEGQQKSQNYTTAMNAGINAHNSGNYAEAKRQFSIALNNCNTEEARQKAQEYYNKSVEAEKSQAKIKAVGDFTNKTVELISYFANRKNALRNSLSQEDAQALLEIVNSENPTDYTQNIIQIFTDLGYTYRETEKLSGGMTAITMNNDVNNINDFLNIFIHPASEYQDYNTISFSYYRKEKLRQQLAVLGDELKGLKRPEIKGVPPSRREKVEQKRILEEQKKTEAINKIEALKPIETEKVVENTITSKSIIDKYILAIGGIEKLKSVQDISITELDQDNFKKEIKIAYGKSSDISTTSKGKIYLKDVFNGKNGFHSALIDDKLYKFEFSDEDINYRKTYQPFKKVFDLQTKNFTVGKIEKFNARDCYSLIEQEKNTNGNNIYSIYYYFDLENGLLLGKKSFKNSTPDDINYEFYNNYSNIEGILFPLSRIEFEDKDRENSTKIRITVKLNQGLSKSDFK